VVDRIAISEERSQESGVRSQESGGRSQNKGRIKQKAEEVESYNIRIRKL